MPDYREFVTHPRYGQGPRITGLNPETDDAGHVFLHWHSPKDSRIPNTAIPADLSRQSPATVPVTHYFDVRRQCRDCGKPFIFFAAEQQYWYEELGFGLDSDCVRCIVCRKKQQGIGLKRERYEELFHVADRTAEQNLEMADGCLSLVEAHVFHKQKLQHVRAILKRIPSDSKEGTQPKVHTLWERLHALEGDDGGSASSRRMSNHAELTGKVAVVTGATRRAGIGAAIARELVVAGAAVFIAHFRDYDQQKAWGIAPEEPESILAALGASGAGTEIDLSESSAAVQLFDRAISRFGHVDILVNNAAYWEGGRITEVTAAQLDRHYAVNIRAAVLLCGEFVRRRGPGAGGRIINITSGQGLTPMPGDLAYAVTKAGLDALTLSLSAGLAESGVAVNAIDPGPTDTGWISDDLRARLVVASAAGRIGTPQDVAAVVRFLSGDAAAHVTGRIIRLQSNGVVEDLIQLLTPGE